MFILIGPQSSMLKNRKKQQHATFQISLRHFQLRRKKQRIIMIMMIRIMIVLTAMILEEVEVHHLPPVLIQPILPRPLPIAMKFPSQSWVVLVV